MDEEKLDDLIAWLETASVEASISSVVKALALLAREALDKRRWYACSEHMPPVGQPVLAWSVELTYFVESFDGTGWGTETDGYVSPGAEPEVWCFIPGRAPDESGRLLEGEEPGGEGSP